MAVDYSKLSDEELDKLLAAEKPDYSALSDEELDKEIAKLGGGASSPIVLNEPANLSGRFLVKNFGGDTASQIDYLKSKNPGIEISEINGEIVARKPGDTGFKKLDPSGIEYKGFYPSINLKGLELSDLTDVAYDVPAALLQSIATGAAGAAGAAGGGVTAIPAAMAAGGASGAGLESLRQGIGKLLGVRKDYDAGDIKSSGAIGALSPLLLGTGASGAQIAKTATNPNAAAKAFTRATTEFVPKGTALTEAEKLVAQQAMQDSQRGILAGFGSKFIGKFTGAAKPEVISKATEEVSPKLVEELSSLYRIDPAKRYTHLEMADILEKQGGGDLGGKVAQEVMSSIEQKKQATGAVINEALKNSPDVVDVGQYKTLLDNYVNENSLMFKRTKNPLFQEEAVKAAELSKMFKPVEGQDKYVMNASDAMAFKNHLTDLIGGISSPLQMDKKSAVSKQLTGKLIQAENALSSDLDAIISKQGSPGARQAYKENRDLMRSVYPYFKNEETAFKTIQNLDANNKSVLRNKLKEVDPKIAELADIAAVWKTFGNPSSTAISAGGGTSTGKILTGTGAGGAIGYGLGLATGIPGAGAAGAAIGGTAGNLATAPSVVKAGLQAKTLVNRLVKSGMSKTGAQAIVDNINRQISKLPASVQPAASKQTSVPLLWNMINNGGE